MTRFFGCKRRLLTAAVTMVGFTVIHFDARAAETMTTAQMQMDHTGQAAMAGGQTFRLGNLTVTSPWTRATPGGAKIAGGYLKVTNNGAAADRFVKATSDAADHVEIHEMSMSGGVMRMRPVPEGLEIKPGETVELKSGGYHLMFMDLKQALKQGGMLKATLQFEKAGPLDVNFTVNAVGSTSATAPQH
ncbi:copper chaperone PCu(A)C [uncultured Bradyrhizobium sp.]|uniref:copper chaperone PCu(A)C n=1 Tax=uncultured Bradyrhizobium sp. TaxID=199684 RepID=UPI0035CA3E8C